MSRHNAAKCIASKAAIWVLRRTVLGKIERLLTIGLDPQNRAVQVRGFSNRVAFARRAQDHRALGQGAGCDDARLKRRPRAPDMPRGVFLIAEAGWQTLPGIAG
ncbi:hypothetical protein [Mesorhizobium caraganae]|uniref:hypothetical protein n=1 Tax=Mesorhizobium caraganae TaxID=483206 RepID=UPI00289E34E4|nr:hypothetical protein [Mesorhizobium caraganae]